jgi:hypothetical protein
LIGEITWEPKISFIEIDGTENDIFKNYNDAHPIAKKRKRLNSQQPELPTNAKKHKANKKTPRASKKAKSTSQ